MFDFRYHVASLAAVFVALVIGVLFGVGLSGQGFVTDSERTKLEDRINDLSARVDAERQRADDLVQGQQAAAAFAADAYPLLVADRLKGKKVAVVVVGSRNDSSVVDEALDAVRDAGGQPIRAYSLRMPVDNDAVQGALRGRPALAAYRGEEHLADLGRDIGRELVQEGPTPLLDTLSDQLVEERSGPSRVGADAVFVVRNATPQQGMSARFVNGLYEGIGSAGSPAVGVEATDTTPTGVRAFARNDLSTVDDVDTASGKLALVLLLGGGREGNYGVKELAKDGILPPIEPLPAEPEPDGGG
jgi:hypothetical protein